jgi:hypothetical protein
MVLLAIILPACATYNGVAEFAAYRDSYTSAAETGDRILDRIAVAERKLFHVAYPFDPRKSTFDPTESSYFVDIIDPPATASYRRTLHAVRTYNDLLYGLASGEEAAAIAGKITRLSAIGAGAAADLAAIGGLQSSFAPLVTANAVNGVLKNLEPLTATLIGFATREEFRKKLLEQEPVIRETIEKVVEETPKMFLILQTTITTAADNDRSRTGLTQDEIDQIRRYRSLLGNWVVLLNASLASLDVAIDAAQSDGAAGNFDGLLLTSEELAAAVRSARINMAGGE